MRVAGIWPLCCMLLYCIGVMCSNPGGGTSQYRLGLRLLDDFLPRSPRSLDLDLQHVTPWRKESYSSCHTSERNPTYHLNHHLPTESSLVIFSEKNMSLYLLLSSLSLSLLLSLSRLLDLSLSLLRDLFSLFTLSSPILMDIHKILWKNQNLKTLLASVAKYKLCFPAFLWLGRWGPEPKRAAIGAALADWNSSKWRTSLKISN